jgi:hypothetical protein
MVTASAPSILAGFSARCDFGRRPAMTIISLEMKYHAWATKHQHE